MIKVHILVSSEGSADLLLEFSSEFNCMNWVVPKETLNTIVNSQYSTLKLLTESNDELASFNEVCQIKYAEVSHRFNKTIPLIRQVSKDLHSLHKTLLKMKKKLCNKSS